jgi:hypothetical protein
MGLLTAIGISVGALIVVWVYLTAGAFASLGLITWAGVISWAIFYAAGGGVAAYRKSIGSILTGNFYAAIALFAFAHTGGGPAVLALFFGIVTFFMCTQARFEPLSFIPGTFLGAGTWVGAAVAAKGADGGAFNSIAEILIPITMILGATFGIASEWGYKKLMELMPSGAPLKAGETSPS